MTNKFKSEPSSLKVHNKILDSITKPESVISLNLSIKASHAGKVNTNNVFYTPRSMLQGSMTLIEPFPKHIQRLHRGNAVGVISKAEYIDYSNNYTDNIKTLNNKINQATDPRSLVNAVKELVKSKEYSEPSYLGLGVLNVNAELHDKFLINELTSGRDKGKVSIGGDSYSVFCSICGEMYDDKHIHQRGQSYNGERCFAIYDNMELDHIGFVPDPADSNTGTTIIQDSITTDLSGNSITIESYKIQDNIQGNSMTLTVDKLKELSKTADGVFGLDVFNTLDPKVVEALKTKFTAELASTRQSSFLFSVEKALPLQSKETVALAKLVIDQLDENDPEKKALEALVQTSFTRKFKDDKDADAKTFIDNYKVEETKEKNKTEVVKETPAFTDESINALSDLVANKILEGMKPKQGIEDAVSLKQLIANNTNLSEEIEALVEENTKLQESTKELYVQRILELKDATDDEEYRAELMKRNVDTIKCTLSDLSYTNKKTTTKKTDTVDATKEAEDKVEKTAPLAKQTVEDAVQNKQTEQTTDTDVKLTDAQFIQKFGYAKFLKEGNK